MALKPDPLSELRWGLEPKGQSLDCAAHRLRQSDGEESAAVVVCLPADCADATACGASPSQGLSWRVTPELEYLQAKWAARLPYRQAAAMLKEVLPLDKGISSSGIRNQILDIGKQLDADIDRDIAKLPQAVADVSVRESSHVAAVSVDSAWLRNCDSGRRCGRHENIVAGRATFTDGAPKSYAYVPGKSHRLQRGSISSSAGTVWRAMNA